MAGVSTGTGFAANVLRGLWNKIVEVVEMIRDLPTAVRDMNGQVQRLKDVTDDINAVLAQEHKNAKTIVQNWLNKADIAIQSSESINSEYEQHKNCLGFCPNCLCRYRTSKEVRAWKLTVNQLHSEKRSDFPSSGDYGDLTPLTQIPILHPEFAGNGIQAAQSKLERWLIEDTNIRVIGVYGMGGVGKTSLLKTINNSHKVSESFPLIIWVTVSKVYDILNLQDCIADRLNIELPDRSNSVGREYKLSSHLRARRFILILDDMWRSLKLESLGVSFNDTDCKIVLSTRSKVVCRQMKVDEFMRVEPLSEEEGWELFCKGAFRNGNVPREIEDVARKIAGECKGLPLAINVVAAAMENDPYRHQWELALGQMQAVDGTFYDMHQEIEEDLFQPLKWSYDVLPDYLKTCFVYFAAYPEDEEISCQEVIDIWIVEGLVKGSGESYLPDIAHSFINFLKDRCLVEVVRKDVVERISCVKIHDVLRDLAIRIAEKEHSCYFKVGQGVTHFPIEEVDGCARMSLMSNDLQYLPTTFACSSLSILLLRKNRLIREVPESFLLELTSLKVLDLSYTGITSLPPSIGNLKGLAYLQLEGCDGICELPETIGDLKELQFLNVKGCRELRCLPERISEVKSLRVLDTSFCSRLNHLPRVISELVSLERLGSHISMNFKLEANDERKYACLKDLQSLRRLRDLSVRIKSPVGEGVIGNWSNMRTLWLTFVGVASQHDPPQDMQAMKDLEYLRLHGCNLTRGLPSWVSQFRRLAHLDLWNCKQIRYLDLGQQEWGMDFPKLEVLTLAYLESLQYVALNAVTSTLPMLKTLDISRCDKLKRLRGEWDKLKCLEEIRSSPMWWDAIQCDDANIKTSLESKFRRRND